MAGSPSYYYSNNTKELQKNIEEELKNGSKKRKKLQEENESLQKKLQELKAEAEKKKTEYNDKVKSLNDEKNNSKKIIADIDKDILEKQNKSDAKKKEVTLLKKSLDDKENDVKKINSGKNKNERAFQDEKTRIESDIAKEKQKLQEKEAEKNQNNADTDELNKSIRDLNDQLLGKKDELKNELDKKFKEKIEDDFKKQLETYFDTISNSINMGKLKDFITDLKNFVEILDRCKEYSREDYTIQQILDDAVECFENLQKLAGYTKEDLLIDQITGVGDDNLFRLEKFDMIDDNIKKTLFAIVELYGYFDHSNSKLLKKKFTHFNDTFSCLDTIYDSPDKQTIMNMTNDVFIDIPDEFSSDFQTYKQAYLPEKQVDDTRDCLVGYNRLRQQSAGKVSVSYTKRAEDALKAAGTWRAEPSSTGESSSGDIDENNRIKDCSMFDEKRATILNTIKYQEIINNFREIEGKFLNEGKSKYGKVGGLVSGYLYSGYSTENNKKMDIIDGFDKTEIQSLNNTDLSEKIADYKQLSTLIKHRIETHNASFDNLWNDFVKWARELSDVRSKTIFGNFFKECIGLKEMPQNFNQIDMNNAFFKNSFENCPDIIYFMMNNFYTPCINDLVIKIQDTSERKLKQIFMRYINDNEKRKIVLHIKQKIEGDFLTLIQNNIDAIENTIIFFIYNVNLLYCKTKATDKKLDDYLQLLLAEKEEREKRDKEEKDAADKKAANTLKLKEYLSALLILLNTKKNDLQGSVDEKSNLDGSVESLPSRINQLETDVEEYPTSVDNRVQKLLDVEDPYRELNKLKTTILEIDEKLKTFLSSSQQVDSKIEKSQTEYTTLYQENFVTTSTNIPDFLSELDVGDGDIKTDPFFTALKKEIEKLENDYESDDQIGILLNECINLHQKIIAMFKDRSDYSEHNENKRKCDDLIEHIESALDVINCFDRAASACTELNVNIVDAFNKIINEINTTIFSKIVGDINENQVFTSFREIEAYKTSIKRKFREVKTKYSEKTFTCETSGDNKQSVLDFITPYVEIFNTLKNNESNNKLLNIIRLFKGFYESSRFIKELTAEEFIEQLIICFWVEGKKVEAHAGKGTFFTLLKENDLPEAANPKSFTQAQPPYYKTLKYIMLTSHDIGERFQITISDIETDFPEFETKLSGESGFLQQLVKKTQELCAIRSSGVGYNDVFQAKEKDFLQVIKDLQKFLEKYYRLKGEITYFKYNFLLNKYNTVKQYRDWFTPFVNEVKQFSSNNLKFSGNIELYKLYIEFLNNYFTEYKRQIVRSPAPEPKREENYGTPSRIPEWSMRSLPPRGDQGPAYIWKQLDIFSNKTEGFFRPLPPYTGITMGPIGAQQPLFPDGMKQSLLWVFFDTVNPNSVMSPPYRGWIDPGRDANTSRMRDPDLPTGAFRKFFGETATFYNHYMPNAGVKKLPITRFSKDIKQHVTVLDSLKGLEMGIQQIKYNEFCEKLYDLAASLGPDEGLILRDPDFKKQFTKFVILTDYYFGGGLTRSDLSDSAIKQIISKIDSNRFCNQDQKGQGVLSGTRPQDSGIDSGLYSGRCMNNPVTDHHLHLSSGWDSSIHPDRKFIRPDDRAAGMDPTALPGRRTGLPDGSATSRGRPGSAGPMALSQQRGSQTARPRMAWQGGGGKKTKRLHKKKRGKRTRHCKKNHTRPLRKKKVKPTKKK